MSLRWSAIIVLSAGLLCGSCSPPRKRLNISERKVCLARGGYESTAPFGAPFCQQKYADGGKVCSGKSDCQGQCIAYEDNSGPELKFGQTIIGYCEAEHSTFGCYANVEGGRSQGVVCVD